MGNLSKGVTVQASIKRYSISIFYSAYLLSLYLLLREFRFFVIQPATPDGLSTERNVSSSRTHNGDRFWNSSTDGKNYTNSPFPFFQFFKQLNKKNRNIKKNLREKEVIFLCSRSVVYCNGCARIDGYRVAIIVVVAILVVIQVVDIDFAILP